MINHQIFYNTAFIPGRAEKGQQPKSVNAISNPNPAYKHTRQPVFLSAPGAKHTLPFKIGESFLPHGCLHSPLLYHRINFCFSGDCGSRTRAPWGRASLTPSPRVGVAPTTYNHKTPYRPRRTHPCVGVEQHAERPSSLRVESKLSPSLAVTGGVRTAQSATFHFVQPVACISLSLFVTS